MDGYRVTGPARQLFAAALPRPSWGIATTLSLFQRSANPTPLVEAARRLGAPVRVVRDRFPGDPRAVVALAALVRKPEVHIVQTHGYKANVLGRLIATVLRRPWIAFLHGDTWENRKVRAYFALERLAVRRADSIVVVSHDMARRLVSQGVPSAKIQVIHNACLVGSEGDAHPWNADAPPVVGVIGRLSPEKGVDLALQIHSIVTRHLPTTRLLIVGEGPERVALERHADQLGIGRSVCWLGYQDEVAKVYRQLTLLLIPSRSEGLPNVALEAMGYGIPVVAASVGGIPEIVDDGENGFLAPPDNAEALAQQVLCILKDPSLRRRLGQRAREEMGSRFSLEARLRALSGIYERVRT
jgi:glycosyltransferase involved in cell wall biosynthesis